MIKFIRNTTPNTAKSDGLDNYQKKALECALNGENLFITGKAGTGKTTLLRRIKDANIGKKVVAVLAPTGVAAENAGGFTMHSFLQLPLKPYLPDHKIRPNLYQLDALQASVVRSIDMLIIDEISMVRCDMLDATDAILRHYRNNNKPFGGVQLVMFGDLYQLCPVAVADEKETLDAYYESLYFFSSYALRKLKYRVIELEKIHRQDNRDFIQILNKVRVGDVEYSDIKELDKRVEPDFRPKVTDSVVTLMTHIRKTDEWNAQMFDKLSTSKREYKGRARNWHGERFPASYHLELKIGSRVMFLRNDNDRNQYQNGTLGWVRAMSEDVIHVDADNGKSIALTRARWDQLKYFVDKKTKTIYTEVSGTYSQFPLKLAWAVSIHKSQGLTFDEVAIDAAKSFTFGQVYVALSRCRTLEGIHLLTKIPAQKIIADDVVKQYMSCIDSEGRVRMPKKFEQDDYEKEPLKLNLRSSRFDSIIEKRTNRYARCIHDEQDAKMIFKYENGKICVNKTFASQNKDWKYTDTNHGDCPFIVRKYKTVQFTNTTYSQTITKKIITNIDITLDESTNQWKFQFRFSD